MTAQLLAELARVGQVLEKTPETLAMMLAGMDELLLTWRPAPGEWTIKEIIGHLIETDRHAFAGRIELILNEERPELPGWDMMGAVAARRDNERPLAELLGELAAPRPRYAGMVRGLSTAALARPCLHRIGELTLGDFVFEWPYHDLNHAAQIANNIKTYFLPFMGDAMRRAIT